MIPAAQMAELAAGFGTPLYVLDVDALHRNIAELSAAVSPARLLYSFKTNFLPAVTDVVRSQGLGMDVVSGYELRAALARGFAGELLVFNGPVKSPSELALAVDAGVFVNIDAEEEIDELCALAGRLREKIDVGLRVFPPHDVYATRGSCQERGVPSKFGWSIADGSADRMAERIASAPGLRLRGIHAHLGSQIVNGEAFEAALRFVIRWSARSPARPDLDRLNLGGGFGVAGIQRSHAPSVGPSQVMAPRDEIGAESLDVARLAAMVHEELSAQGLGGTIVLFEPGRAIVSDAMFLLTSVAAVKRTNTGTWVLLDGGLNLLPTAGPGERHRFEALRRSAAMSVVHIGGPLCYEGDVFSLSVPMPADIARGDLVAIHDAGAYSLTRATSFNRPRAGVVAVRDGRASLCWRPETDADIFGFAMQPAASSASS